MFIARLIEKLITLSVKKINKAGDYSDGGGLWLRVNHAGAKSWMFRFSFEKREHKMGLGATHTVSLAEARDEARNCRKLLRGKVNPLLKRQQTIIQTKIETESRKTFAECAYQYIEDNRAGWKNAKHANQWTTTLKTYAYPHIGHISVADITTKMVVDLLRPIWVEKAETANRLRGRIQTVLDWAKVQGFRSGDNPAIWQGHLDKILPARSKVSKVVHHPAMPYHDIPTFMKALQFRDGLSIRTLEFAILHANRSGEVRLATWKEIDFDKKLWVIPEERMKAGHEHRIPLTDQAIALLQKLPVFTLSEQDRKDMFIFPSTKKDKPLSDMALTSILRRMNKGQFTQHGFRSTFRDWAAEVVQYPREVIEHALAHKLADKVEAAYQRGDLLEKRRSLMTDWANFCYNQ